MAAGIHCCCIPEAIEARSVGPGDRRAFADRAIREGEVILRNLPTAYSLLDEHRSLRCWHCFLSTTTRHHGRLEETSNWPPTLLRCSRCHQALYCSRRCQELDFPSHKVECRKDSFLLFPETKKSSQQIDNNDASLLVRNFLALRRNKVYCCSHSKDNSDSTVSCGSAHFDNLLQCNTGPLDALEVNQARRAARALWNQRNALQKSDKNSSKAFPTELSELQQQMDQDLRRFRVNNFGVTDDMLRVLASAVYPLGALLNHSCAPNCLLRYTLGQQHQAPVMEIVAAQDIAKGDELTHSYVELVSPAGVRQRKLKTLYGFDCDCRRCCPIDADRFLIRVPRSYTSMQSSELALWILENYNPINTRSGLFKDESLIALDQEGVLKPMDNQKAIQAAEAKLRYARLCMMNGRMKDELCALEEVVSLLETAAKTEKSRILPLLSTPELYKARGERLGSLIVAGQTTDAISECEHIVAFLCIALNHVPNHSLLGLQLFTLGDLYEANGAIDKAKWIFRWASKTLNISHGNENVMVKLLNEKIAQ